MGEVVNPRRRYDSERRREQAAATRLAVLEAAQRLFERDGYAASTVAAIARAAGVSEKTVYLGFETKSGLLRGVWHLVLRGDLEEEPMQRRGWYRQVLEERDPHRKLELLARHSRVVKQRGGRMMGVIRAAAASDPEAAALWERIETDFHDLQGPIVESLRELRALRQGLEPSRAVDLLWALNHPDVWRLLVIERGWSPEEWERWFGDAARAQLLGAAG